MHPRSLRLVLVIATLISTSLLAQQTGSISGRVTAAGQPLPDVTVEARSSVLPLPRVTVTDSGGEYRLFALQPGGYTFSFSISGMQSQTVRVDVLLGQNNAVNVILGMQAVAETITVVSEATRTDPTSTAIKTGIPEDVIEHVPSGQDYRDLLKLAPGVQVTEAEIRGPSAGGSEQDNVYHFDGVNVTLPLFGTLTAEPATHDIAQASIVKGGAKAVDFNRSAGFAIDSISKSGSAEWKGEVKYQIQTDSMTSNLVIASPSKYDEERTWGSANIGGPVLRERLFFFASYYRPTRGRGNGSNLYGKVPDFRSTRDEYFGKVTITPTAAILLNASYRESDRQAAFAGLGAAAAATASVGQAAQQRIGIVEGSWLTSNRSFATLKYTDYGLKTMDRPDLLLSNVVPNTIAGAQLDINNLDRQGFFTVPVPRTGTTPADVAFNNFVIPLIERYGFIGPAGARIGGGAVGAATPGTDQDFFRKAGHIGFDVTLGHSLKHDLHAAYQVAHDTEDLARFSNGWGSITAPGGRATCPAAAGCGGQPIFYQAEFQRTTEGTIGKQVITSEFHSQNFEVNDTIKWRNWGFNAGVMVSNDVFYGEGLRRAENIAGFVAAPGVRYRMYTIPWEKQIQPRLGATWAYNGTDTLYSSYARYNPAASSLPRAASWDRNSTGLINRAYFDQNGKLIGSQPLAASSGKLFVQDLDPRHTDEYMVGTAQQWSSGWSGRFYARYRYSTNFWEDTNNAARINFKAPPAIATRGLYIPDLNARLLAIGGGTTPSGSSYVIAELDGAFTKYYEVSMESDYRRGNSFVRGSYAWSHYYGNFDQDNTSTTYDFATFIGATNIADSGGRQLWNNKYGDLHGDRRHLVKVYGYYTLPWQATAGLFALYQSGHAWEAWNWEPYGPEGENVIGTSTNDTNRYAEPAGSRRTDDHYQLDLTYAQNFDVAGLRLQVRGDLYNATDKQTGYSPQPAVHNALFSVPRLRHGPRRLQLAVRVQF